MPDVFTVFFNKDDDDDDDDDDDESFPLGAGSICRGGTQSVEIPGGVVKKRESPDFRSPEVGISP